MKTVDDTVKKIRKKNILIEMIHNRLREKYRYDRGKNFLCDVIDTYEGCGKKIELKDDLNQFIDNFPIYMRYTEEYGHLRDEHPAVFDRNHSHRKESTKIKKDRDYPRRLAIFSFVADRLQISHSDMVLSTITTYPQHSCIGPASTIQNSFDWNALRDEWNSSNKDDELSKANLMMLFRRANKEHNIKADYFNKKREELYGLIRKLMILVYEMDTIGQSRDIDPNTHLWDITEILHGCSRKFFGGTIDLHALFEELKIHDETIREMIMQIQRYGCLVTQDVLPGPKYEWKNGKFTSRPRIEIVIVKWMGRDQSGRAIEEVFDPPLAYPLLKNDYDRLHAQTGIDFRPAKFCHTLQWGRLGLRRSVFPPLIMQYPDED